MKLFMILVSVLLPATVEAQHILMSKSNLSMTIEAYGGGKTKCKKTCGLCR